MNGALRTVQKFFPGVRKVVVADKPAIIEVRSNDANPRAQKNHEACALAVACKRSMKLDGVIISRSTAYMVKGRQARRFKLPPGTAREVVSFDRGAGFAPGTYILSVVPKQARLGVRQGSDRDKRTYSQASKGFRHLTANIRTVLGGPAPEGE